MPVDMKTASLEAILKSLNANRVRYVIAGGLAVVAHGYLRFTADLDMMVAMDSENLSRAIAVFRSLGYRPRAPVAIEAVLDQATREGWIRDKGLKVFSLNSPAHAATEVDIFLELPLEFEAVYADSVELEVLPGVTARFCSLADLLMMKAKAGRPRDLEDIRQLKAQGEDEHAPGQ